MRHVLVIARNTFRETIRDRALYVLAFFAALVLLCSKALGWVSVAQDIKVITDIGLAAIPFFAVLVAIFVGTGLIYREIEKRTLYTVLSRPVGRGWFVLGRYLGLLATVELCVVLMAAFFLGYLYVWSVLAPAETVVGPTSGVPVFPLLPLLQAICLALFEVALVTAIAVFFSSVSTPILSAFFTFAAYAVGSAADRMLLLGALGADSSGGGGALGTLGKVLYTIAPNFATFNVRGAAVYGEMVPWDEFGLKVLYGVLYTTLVLILAALGFSRRDL